MRAEVSYFDWTDLERDRGNGTEPSSHWEFEDYTEYRP